MREELKPSAPTRSAASGRFSDDELSDIRAGFAQRLRDAFEGASMAEIARRCKTTDSTIKTYLDGDRLPIAEMLLQMQRSTGVNLHWLLTGRGPRRVDPVDELFSDDQEAEIRELAREAGRSFEEQVKVLAVAAAEFRRKID